MHGEVQAIAAGGQNDSTRGRKFASIGGAMFPVLVQCTAPAGFCLNTFAASRLVYYNCLH